MDWHATWELDRRHINIDKGQIAAHAAHHTVLENCTASVLCNSIGITSANAAFYGLHIMVLARNRFRTREGRELEWECAGRTHVSHVKESDFERNRNFQIRGAIQTTCNRHAVCWSIQ